MSKRSKQLKLVVKNGTIRAVYDDALTALFKDAAVDIQRASHVEPANPGESWTIDLTPVGGPTMLYFGTRQQALNAEVDYLNEYVIT